MSQANRSAKIDPVYSTFISYSFADKRIAQWLHREIERWRTPARIGDVSDNPALSGNRFLPAFRDRDELAAASNISDAIIEALHSSHFLIVICSPASHRSKWVNAEIRAFRAMGRGDRIRCLIAEGVPHSDDPDLECLPPALLEDGGLDPLAADIRPGQDGKFGAKLKIIASLIGVGYDTLRRREASRRQRHLTVIASFSTLAFLFTSSLAVYAFISRGIARERTRTAERTVAFVKSMFEVSDPSEAKGAIITAREVLDRGAARIKSDLGNEPAVQTELALTLSEVYGSLGLLQKSDEIVRWTMGIPNSQSSIVGRRLTLLGESQFRMANYENARASFTQAVPLARAAFKERDDLLSRALVGLGQTESALGNGKHADKHLREALAVDSARPGPPERDIARDLEAIGINAYYDGNYTSAIGPIIQAIAIRSRVEGPDSPSLSDNIGTLAAIQHRTGNRPEAERLYRSRLKIDEKVLGPEHPDVGIMLNNIARLLVERRAFAEALPMLERAKRLISRERGQDHDDMAFVLANLAIAKQGMGRNRDAESLFAEALEVARKHQNPNASPVLTELARFKCVRSDLRGAITMLDEAKSGMDRDYPDDKWRSAWVDSVKGECLALAGRKEEARILIRRSAPLILEIWDPDTLYGHEVKRRLQLI